MICKNIFIQASNEFLSMAEKVTQYVSFVVRQHYQTAATDLDVATSGRRKNYPGKQETP